MKNITITITFLFVIITTSFGQSNENYDVQLFGYWVTNEENSEASFQSHMLDAKLFMKPISKTKKNLLMVRAKLSYVKINYSGVNADLFSDLVDFYSIGSTIAYIRIFRNSKWSFSGAFVPQLNSNFTDGVNTDDIFINAAALFNYSNQDKSKISFGLTYTSTLGIPAPVPFINYWKSLSDMWEINLGFPKTCITSNINKKSSVDLYGEFQGFNGNISKDFKNEFFENNGIAQKISYRDIVTGFEYHYLIKSLLLKFNASYTVNREFELQNTDYDSTYSFDMGNNFNIGIGMSFNF